MKSNKSSGAANVKVDMRIGILDTIAKSIYADPKVKIREAVANSMDNESPWFILYMDPPSRSISLMDSGKGIKRGRFDEIFQHIGFGLGRENRFSNSYFGLGLMSILELGNKATIITKSMEEKEVWVDRNEGERVRVAINEFKEKYFVDIRIHYQSEDEDWRPTKKGVSLDADKLDELIKALESLRS